MCELKEEVQCNALKPDGYSRKNKCPDDKPYISPIDNCKCIDRAEKKAMETHNKGPYCKANQTESEEEHVAKPLRICSPDTDSDSDCVVVGDRHINVKANGIDENGNGDSSIYTDSDCDPRFSSCDTNSNEEYSNTDSDTPDEEAAVAKTGQNKEPIRGSLAFHYAKKYGVYVESDTEEEHCYGYDCPHVSCGDRSCHTDDYTLADLTNDSTYTYVRVTSYGSNGTDSCDTSDGPCTPKPEVESESYFSSEETVSEESLPSTGTSRSSNSTGELHSDSESEHDSSSAESTDTEADNSSLSEDLCAHVIMQPDLGTDVWGWVEFYAPALGHFAN